MHDPNCKICHGGGWNFSVQCNPSPAHPYGWKTEKCDCKAPPAATTIDYHAAYLKAEARIKELERMLAEQVECTLRALHELEK